MRIVRFTVDLGPVRELRLRRPSPERTVVNRMTATAPPAADPNPTLASQPVTGGPVL
jgi:hypothetical protein